MVGTGAIIIHKTVFKFYSQIILIILLNLKLPFLTIFFADQKLYYLIIHQISIIKNILHQLAVNGYQYIPWFQFQFLPDTAGNHFGYIV